MRKRLSLTILAAIMSFTLFGQMSKEDKFWNWFVKNEQIYYHQIENLEVRESIFNDLSNRLFKIHSDLAFEFSPIHENGIREFTISAEGLKEQFSIVEKLIDKAPSMEKWKFNAFRQRIPGDDMTIEYDNFKIGYADLFFRFTEMDNILGIELSIRNFKDDGETKNAIYILLDGLIGEYDVTMGIDWIEWIKLDESIIEDLYPITDLRTVLDNRKKK